MMGLFLMFADAKREFTPLAGLDQVPKLQNSWLPESI